MEYRRPDLVWAMPWEKFANDTGDNLMSKLAQTFGKTNEVEGISNSFIYNIRRDFSLFALEDDNSLLGNEEILELLTAEYLRSRAKDKSSELTRDKIQPLMDDLLEIYSIL